MFRILFNYVGSLIRSSLSTQSNRRIPPAIPLAALALLTLSTLAISTNAGNFTFLDEVKEFFGIAAIQASESSSTLSDSELVYTAGTCDTAGPIEVEGSVLGSTPTAYATLADGFAAINAGTHTGAIAIDVCGDTTEGTASALLMASGTGLSSFASINLSPVGGLARTISGAITAGGPLIDLNGADNVTIDGLNSGGNSLTISNTTASATAGTSTIRFVDGATSNTVTNSTILGSFGGTVTTGGGTIYFATDGVTANGNDDNTVSNNNIGPAGANLPTKAIHGSGSTSTAAIGNSGVTITNNNIFDYFGAAVTSSGVATSGGCNTWTISNNRFYQTGTRTWTIGAIHRAIDINNATANSGAQGFTIIDNIVGFASSTQTGTYTLTGSTGKFQGIQFNGITGGTVSSINNNTVASVNLSGVTSSGTSTSSPFIGIFVTNGRADTNNNTVGSQSVTGSLTFSTTTTTPTETYGILNDSFDDWTANANNIGGISVTNLGASGTFLVYGMRAITDSSKVFNAASNNVGGTISDSIQLASTGASSQVTGINANWVSANLTTNTIRNLTNNNGAGTSTGASLIGISTSSAPNHTISQNNIYNLTNTNATAATTVTGIQFTGHTANVVDRNLIYGLNAATSNAAAEVNGIRVAGGTTIYSNNMIAIGAGVANAIGTGSTTGGVNGINEPAGTDSFYHNSVYIGGAPTAGVGPSYAFNSSVTTRARSFRDNIFYNTRTNNGATGKNYAVRVGGTSVDPAGLTINNNLYCVSGAGGVFGFFNGSDVGNLAALRTAIGQDANSFEGDPKFNDPTNANPDLHLNPTTATLAEGNGTDVGVTVDFDGQTRSLLTPVDIGADAGDFATGGDIEPPSIANPSLGKTTSTADRTITISVTDAGSGVPTTGIGLPVLYFRKGVSGAYSPSQCLFTGGGNYDCVFTYSSVGGVVVGDTIQYYVAAQDLAGTPNVAVDPSGGSGLTANPPTASTSPSTPYSYLILIPYSGTRTVCSSGCDFATLTGSAGIFKALNDGVVTGNIDIQINGDLTIGEDGSNSLNSLTEEPAGSNFTVNIRPNAGVSAVVSGSNSTCLINLNGADRVTIDGLGGGSSLLLRNIGTGSTVCFGADATINTIQNTVIEGATTSSGRGVVYVGTGTTTGNDNNTINSNTIRDRSDAAGVPANLVYSFGLSAPAANSGNTISNNILKNFTAAGINISGSATTNFNENWTINGNSIFQETARTTGLSGIVFNSLGTNTISGNTVRDLNTSGTVTAIDLRDARTTTVSRNRVYSILSTSGSTAALQGITFNGSSTTAANATIVNNMVSIVPLFANAQTVSGIKDYGFGGNTFSSYYNSVLIGGNASGAASSWACWRGSASPTNFTQTNNICLNERTGGTGSHFAVGDQSNGTGTFTSNYNIFVGTGATAANFFDKGTSTTGTPVDFATWQAGTRDANSQASNPGGNYTAANMFVSTTNLHAVTFATNPAANAGSPVAGVAIDFDNDARDLTTPDVGADEFITTVLPGTLQFSSSSFTASEGTSATITVNRVGGLTGPVQVDYATSSGTATSGVCGSGGDYVDTSGTLIWADGDIAAKTFTVTLCGDVAIEGTEALTLTLSNVVGTSITGTNPVTFNIADDIVTLGNYSDASVTIGGNIVVLPSVAATNANYATAITRADFTGELEADPATGAVHVTNAYPAGSYLVTVTLSNGPTSFRVRTFTLTVQSGTACSTGISRFTSSADTSAGVSTQSVAVGDFNNDSKQDLAVANSGSNNVSIRLGNGAGGFSGTSNVGVGIQPYSVAIGDFNGDGNQDLATANQIANSVSIRLGDGTGSFSGTTEVGVGINPLSVAIGDFNNDGKQDIAIANTGSNTVSIRLGDGTGSFTGTTNVGVGSQPWSIAVGDFNGDGKQDVAAASWTSDTVSIRIGDGLGGLSGTTIVGVGSRPQSVVVGDFNGDGKKDIAVANTQSNSVSIRLGNGTGGFGGTTNVGVGSFPKSLAIGDFNNDGKQDFAAANANSNSVSIRYGDGLGGFSGTSNVVLTTNPTSIAVGDFNNDGKQDFAAALSNSAAIRLGDCDLPPTIVASTGLSRQQGTSAGNAQIATVADDGGSGNVGVTVTSANPSNGITISNIVNTGGNITADFAVDCSATNASFTLSSSDASFTATDILNVTVTPNTAPTLAYFSPQSVGFGGSLNVIPTAASDNGSVAFSILPGHGLSTAPTVDAAGAVSIANAQPVGTHTITIRSTDSCGLTTDASFNVDVPNPSSGDLEIGVGGTFSTLGQAIAALAASGIDAPTRLILIDPAYPSETFPITIPSIPGASATNTLTIQPGTGVSPTISGSSTGCLVNLNGIDYLTIDGSNGGGSPLGTSKDLTLSNTSTSGATVCFTNAATNNTLRNAFIKGVSTSTSNGVVYLSTVLSGTTGNSSNTVVNNDISGGATAAANGIFNLGTATAKNAGNAFMGNRIFDFSNTGIRDNGNSANADYSHNEIFELTSRTTALTGFRPSATSIDGFKFTQNYIHDLNTTSTGIVVGIHLFDTSTVATSEVSNNIVTLSPTAPLTLRGIWDQTATGEKYNIYFNSVFLGGTVAGASNSETYYWNIASTSSVKNNIFVNARTGGTGKHYAYRTTTALANLVSDYNDIYNTGGTGNVFGHNGTAAVADLVAWRLAPTTGTGKDAGSISADPLFLSTAYLHVGVTSPVVNAGTPISGITVDFDGETRDGFAPEIGADEIMLAGSGTVQFNGAAYSGAEGTTATITVNRVGGLTGAVQVDYATIPGTATSGVCGSGGDYVDTNGTLFWADGDIAAKTFTVTLCGDVAIEVTEALTLILSNVVGTSITGTNPVTLDITDASCSTILTESFDNITSLPGSGWVLTNHSTTIGTTGWFQGVGTTFPSQTGLSNAYIGANYLNTTGSDTISNWLLTPTLTFQNGDTMTFWTRTRTPAGGTIYPDRLQVRMSLNASSPNVGTTATDVGDFSTLMLDINPTYTVTGYPLVWTQFTVTVSGVSTPTTGRLAFRYFTENGGPLGANSDYIGIDTVQINRCNPSPTPLTVTYNGNGGSGTAPVDNTPYASGSLVTVAGQGDLLRTGYSFTRWNTNSAGTGTHYDAGTGSFAITANTTLYAEWTLITYSITASAGSNGSIGPSGAVSVNHGANQTFAITPATNYHVADVLVDGVTVSAVTSYTFTGVTANHTITASFAVDPSLCPAITTPVMPTLRNASITIPVSTTDLTGRGVISTDFTFTYNPTVMTPTAHPATAGSVWVGLTTVVTSNVVPDTLTSSKLIVSIYDASNPAAEASGAGTLVDLHFTASGTVGGPSPMTISRFLYNGGMICTDPQVPGSITVVNATVQVENPGTPRWGYYDDVTNLEIPTDDFVFGPTGPPLGVGSARFLTTATGNPRSLLALGTQAYNGKRLADISTLSYETYVASGFESGGAPTLQFNVDFDLTSADSNYQGRVVYVRGPLTSGTWAHSNLMDSFARFWYSDLVPLPTRSECTQTIPCTRAQMLASHPNMGIHANPFIGALLFSSEANANSNVDKFTIGVNVVNTMTSYSFEPGTSTVTVICPATQTYTGSPIAPCTASYTTSDLSATGSLTAVISYTTNTDVGTVTASATWGGDINYAGSNGSTTFNITPAYVTTTAGGGTGAYTGSNQTPTGCVVTGAYIGTLVCSNNPATVGPSVGTYATVPVPSGDTLTNYNITLNNGSYSITPAEVTATAGGGTGPYTGSAQTPTGCVVTGAYIGTLVCSNNPATVGPNVGPYATIPVPSGDTLSNFNITLNNGSFQITTGTINGRVLYSIPLPGTEVPVPGVALDAPSLTGAPDVTGTTGLGGLYTLTNFGAGAYRVTPFRSPQVCSTDNGIDVNDASLVARHVVGITKPNGDPLLSGDALLAGKVSGTATAELSSYDAGLIARKVVELCNGPNISGQWFFTPAYYDHASVSGAPLTEDYTAYMMGDVDGSWVTAASPGRSNPVDANSEGARDAVRASVPNTEDAQNSVVTVPFNIGNLRGRSIDSYQFNIEYDPTVLEPVANSASGLGTLSSELSVISNAPEPGHLKVAVYGVVPVTGDGVYVNLRFRTIGSVGSTSPLTIDGFRFNDGRADYTVVNGMFTVTAASASASVHGRLLTAGGQGVRNARVVLTSTTGTRFAAVTAAFGYYEFTGLAVGETYTVSVESRRYTFSPRTISITANATEFDMIADQ